jgi:ankyrin repeat protein
MTRRELLSHAAVLTATFPEIALPEDAPLFVAVRKGDGETVRRLLTENPELAFARDQEGATALYLAASLGQQKAFDPLFMSGADCRFRHAGTGKTVLQAVLASEDLARAEAMAERMLANGVPPDDPQADRTTPLHLAAERGSVTVTRLLIRKGADVNARDAQGKTAAERAAAKGQKETEAVLRDHARIPRDCQTSRFAYDGSGKPFVRRDDPEQPVLRINAFVGAGHGNRPKVEEMVAANPTLVSLPSTLNELAVEGAAHVGNHELAKYLLEKGAPLSLCTAAMLGRADRVAFLLNEDAKRIHERGAHDFPLVWYPAIGGNGAEQREAMRLLLKAGVGVNDNLRGRTALHWAAGGGHLDMVKLLLDSGADPNIRQKTETAEVTPLTAAKQRNHTAVVELLEKRGGRE